VAVRTRMGSDCSVRDARRHVCVVERMKVCQMRF